MSTLEERMGSAKNLFLDWDLVARMLVFCYNRGWILQRCKALVIAENEIDKRRKRLQIGWRAYGTRYDKG